jgi:signal transduction histidine kinase
MLRRKLITTAFIACVVVGAVMAVDFVLDIVILHDYASYTPLITFAIALIVALPVVYWLVSTQFNLRDARDALAKARDSALAASRAKSEFLANMSHELRTPLNAIIGFSELLCSDAFAERREEYARMIHTSGTHLLELVDSILDLSRIEANKIELQNEDIDVNDLIRECMVFVEPRAQEGHLRLVYRVSPRLPHILADRRALKQILLNLLANACKFTHAGGSVEAFARVETDGGICLGVKDEGTGIAEEEQARMFERFGQGRHDIKQAAKGTGLGLPIVKGLTEAHGGRVLLQSRPGEGTCVTVWLPRARVRPQKRSAAA